MTRLRRSLEHIAQPSQEHYEQNPHDHDLTPQSTNPYACTMECRNGGKCRLNRAIHGFAAELLEDVRIVAVCGIVGACFHRIPFSHLLFSS